MLRSASITGSLATHLRLSSRCRRLLAPARLRSYLRHRRPQQLADATHFPRDLRERGRHRHHLLLQIVESAHLRFHDLFLTLPSRRLRSGLTVRPEQPFGGALRRCPGVLTRHGRNLRRCLRCWTHRLLRFILPCRFATGAWNVVRRTPRPFPRAPRIFFRMGTLLCSIACKSPCNANPIPPTKPTSPGFPWE